MHKTIYKGYLFSLSLWFVALPAASESIPHPILSVYYPDWKIYNPKNPRLLELPSHKMTHLVYAFFAVCGPINHSPPNIQKLMQHRCYGQPDGSAVLLDDHAALQTETPTIPWEKYGYQGAFAELHTLFEQNPAITIVASLGGWTLSEPFHSLAVTPQYRKNFTQSLNELLNKYPFFSGIQIDWEYPGGHGLSGLGANNIEEEKQGFTALLAETRAMLDQLEGTHHTSYELSVSINASEKFDGSIDWPAVTPNINHVYLMSYDYLGNWDPTAGHHSNVYATNKTPNGRSMDQQVRSLLCKEIPREKIVVGSPFYGRGWQKVQGFSAQNMEGLRSGGGLDKGSNIKEPGYFTFYDIARHFLTKPQLGFEYHYDTQAEAAVLFNPKQNEYISFEDQRSAKAKANYVRDNGLGGVFVWEITADYENQLLNAIYDGLSPHP